ncbi:hypothetical protein R6Y99_21835 [Pseudomonas lundensis]|uniref:hypothetical protein n=1 Tax=Serratia proteamaculans TaxID=28151 RepID=UPI0029827899|nr:hypothetical protein [Serratia proteamaculans]MDW5502442.1 hypothetical protein [Serratia proteamaculans]MDW5507498.1 hypothetical protein [Pseudomonas lundensis]
MAQMKKLWLIVPLIFGFSSAKADLLSPAEIDQSVFAKGSNLPDQFYFNGPGNKPLQATSCADFYRKYQQFGPPVEQTRNAMDFNTLRQNLGACLINHSLRAGSFTAGHNGLAIGTPASLPERLPALMYQAISNESVKLRDQKVSAGKSLKAVDASIHFVDKKDGVFNLADNSDGNYAIDFLGAGRTSADGEKVYVVEQNYSVQNATYRSTRYFLLTPEKDGRYGIETEVIVFP